MSGAIILLAPTLGGIVAFRWPSSVGALAAAALLVGIAAVLGLIGGWGLLFVLPLALFLLGAVRAFRENRKGPSEGRGSLGG